jgi:hypothetical protein
MGSIWGAHKTRLTVKNNDVDFTIRRLPENGLEQLEISVEMSSDNNIPDRV